MSVGKQKLGKNNFFFVSQKAIIQRRNKILILLKATRGSKKWELPGGILSVKETMDNGFKREVLEETSLKIIEKKLISAWDKWTTLTEFGNDQAKMIGIAYLCRDSGREVKLSREHLEYRWATKSELKKLKFSHNSKIAIREFLSRKILK